LRVSCLHCRSPPSRVFELRHFKPLFWVSVFRSPHFHTCNQLRTPIPVPSPASLPFSFSFFLTQSVLQPPFFIVVFSTRWQSAFLLWSYDIEDGVRCPTSTGGHPLLSASRCVTRFVVETPPRPSPFSPRFLPDPPPTLFSIFWPCPDRGFSFFFYTVAFWNPPRKLLSPPSFVTDRAYFPPFFHPTRAGFLRQLT